MSSLLRSDFRLRFVLETAFIENRILYMPYIEPYKELL